MLSVKGKNVIDLTIRNKADIVNNKSQLNPAKPMQKPPLPKKNNRNISNLRHQYVCDQRKQNILNSRFLRKKQQLFDITRQNVRLFQKINSQKSIYSHQSLNKSYQSNRSLINSRLSNQSKNELLKNSKVSNCSRKSLQSNKSNKNRKTFFNRANSVTSVNKPNIKKIIVHDVRRNSLINLKDKNVQNTKPQDIQQFAKLFNIKQEPTLKQRNRPIRIRSTKLLKPIKPTPQMRQNKIHKYPSSKQIVINEENQIQIHQEIEICEDFQTFRANNLSISQKKKTLDQQSKRKLSVLQQETKLNIPVIRTQQSQKSHVTISKSQRSLLSVSKVGNQNAQNLFDIKNSLMRSKLQKKFGVDQGVTIKYKNLVDKINSELHKFKIRPKQSAIYPLKSRLIG